LSFVIHDVLRQEHRQKTARWMQGLWAQAQPASLHARIDVPLNLRRPHVLLPQCVSALLFPTREVR